MTPDPLGPTSIPVQVVAGVAVLALIATTVWRWHRLRAALRVIALLLVQVALVLALLIRINASEQLLTTWSTVGGSANGLHPTVVVDHGLSSPTVSSPFDANAWISPPGEPSPDKAAAAGSTIASITLQGASTGYALPAKVYLPGGYQNQTTRSYPVIELLDGYPGGPQFWLDSLHLKDRLDRLIATGRIPPVIAILPTQNPVPGRDSECIDATAGYAAQAESYLTIDVPTYVKTHYRAATGRINWVLGGYSTGGYGAAVLGLRHPDVYGSIISLSGYLHPIEDHTTGQLFARSSDARAHSVDHLLHHAHRPMAIYLIAANDNKRDRNENRHFVANVPPTDALRSVATTSGGHSSPVWLVGFVDALQWLSTVNRSR